MISPGGASAPSWTRRPSHRSGEKRRYRRDAGREFPRAGWRSQVRTATLLFTDRQIRAIFSSADNAGHWDTTRALGSGFLHPSFRHCRNDDTRVHFSNSPLAGNRCCQMKRARWLEMLANAHQGDAVHELPSTETDL